MQAGEVRVEGGAQGRQDEDDPNRTASSED